MAGNPINAIISAAAKHLGTQNFNNFCQAFVEKVTKGKTGIYPSAITAWQQQQNKAVSGTRGMKPGDVIYFSPNASNQGYGHTGIYVGNNKFISATGKGVAEVDLSQWQQMTGQQLLGYVPQEGDGGATIDQARASGQNFNGEIVNNQFRELASSQNTSPTMPQGDQQGQQGANPNVSMPQIQNPAGQTTPYPLRETMGGGQGAYGGQQNQYGQYGTSYPTMPIGGYGSTGYGGTGAYDNSFPTYGGAYSPTDQASLSPQQQAQQSSVPATPPTSTTDPSQQQAQQPQTYQFGPISISS